MSDPIDAVIDAVQSFQTQIQCILTSYALLLSLYLSINGNHGYEADKGQP